MADSPVSRGIKLDMRDLIRAERETRQLLDHMVRQLHREDRIANIKAGLVLGKQVRELLQGELAKMARLNKWANELLRPNG